MIRSTLRTLALSAALSLSGAAAFAAAAFAAAAPSGLDGVYRTAEGNGLVTFRPCGDALCGYLVDASSPDTPGQTLLIDRLMRVDQGWSGGRIINPHTGKIYAGDVQPLQDGRIKVTGCLVRPLCGSQVWRRAQ